MRPLYVLLLVAPLHIWARSVHGKASFPFVEEDNTIASCNSGVSHIKLRHGHDLSKICLGPDYSLIAAAAFECLRKLKVKVKNCHVHVHSRKRVTTSGLSCKFFGASGFIQDQRSAMLIGKTHLEKLKQYLEENPLVLNNLSENADAQPEEVAKDLAHAVTQMFPMAVQGRVYDRDRHVHPAKHVQLKSTTTRKLLSSHFKSSQSASHDADAVMEELGAAMFYRDESNIHLTTPQGCNYSFLVTKNGKLLQPESHAGSGTYTGQGHLAIWICLLLGVSLSMAAVCFAFARREAIQRTNAWEAQILAREEALKDVLRSGSKSGEQAAVPEPSVGPVEPT